MNPAAPESGGRLAIDLGSAPSTPAPKHPIPAIPDHDLLRCIGHGSYGEVWLARTVLGECRAVKVVFRCAFGDNRPFEREFEGIQRYEPVSRSHPSQVQILHVGINPSGGYFYYVMELADDARGNPKAEIRDAKETPEKPTDEARMTKAVASDFVIRNSDLYTPRTLRQELERHDRLPLAQCIQIGLELTTALEHLHQHGLVHRDVKPSNIIFVGGVPKLADIGLVTEAGDGKSIVGTEGYLAPEGPGSASADLYSLGKVLYEISTGRDRRHFPDLPADFQDWPDRQALLELNEVLLKACAQDSCQRYQTASAMRADLETLQRGQSVKRKRLIERRFALGKKVVLVAAALALLIAALPLVRVLSRGKTWNPEAVRLYDLGRWHHEKFSDEDRKAAIIYLNQAIQIDTNFTPAYTMLFELHVWDLDAEEKLRVCRQLAERLMALDPKLAEAHTAVSWTKYLENDWRGALEEMKQAIELNPNYPTAHTIYCYYLSLLGRVEEALKQAKIADQLEPASRLQGTVNGFPFVAARQYDLAIYSFRKVVKLDRSFPLAHRWLAKSFEAKGDYLNALGEYEELDRLSGAEETQLAREYGELRRAFQEAGVRGYWLKALEMAETAGTLIANSKEKLSENGRYDLAMIYAQLGEKQKALDELEKAYDTGERDDWLKFEPLYEPLRAEPRFQALLKKLGLEH